MHARRLRRWGAGALLGAALLVPVMLVPVLLVPVLLVRPAFASPMQVKVEDQHLSVELGRVPLKDVLTAVAEQTGARLSVRGDLGSVAPQAFTDVPIAQALARLAAANGLLLQFAPAKGGTAARLVSIHAVAPKTEDEAPSGELQPYQAVVHAPPARGGMPPNFWDYHGDMEKLPEVDVRLARLNQIGRQRGPMAEAALATVITTDPEPVVRSAAVRLLAPFKTDEARTALTQAASDGEPAVRVEAMRALASQPTNVKPVEVMVRALMGDDDRDVRITVASLLSSRDGPTAKAALEAAAGADQDQQLRDIARQSLRR